MSKGLDALKKLGNKEFRDGKCVLQINDTYEYDDIEKELKALEIIKKKLSPLAKTTFFPMAQEEFELLEEVLK